MQRFWQKISHIGMRSGLPDHEARNLIFVNRITAILSFFVATAILINVILHSPVFIPVLSAALFLLILIYGLNHLGHFSVAKASLMLVSLALLFYMCITAGLGSALEFYFLSLTVLPVLIFSKRRTIFFYQALCILCLIGQKVYVDIYLPGYPERQLDYQVFYIVNSIYASLLVILAVSFFHTLIRRRETELVRSNENIEAKNMQLETANKDLDAFNYSVSHDIRSPLRSIDGFGRILEAKYSQNMDEEGRELLSLIRQNTNRMQALTEDLLTLSKAGKQELAKRKIKMSLLVQDVISELDDEIRQGGVTVKVGELDNAVGDPALIHQVWANLLSNAIKYSSKNELPVVSVNSEMHGDTVVYSVSDNGIGFDMKYANKLFKAFERLHTQADYAGTGVGLAIVQNVISRHGGQVWAEGKPGDGATFYFSLPA